MQTRSIFHRGHCPAAVSLLSSLPLLAGLLAMGAGPARATDTLIDSPWTGNVPIYVGTGDTLTITGNGSVTVQTDRTNAIIVDGGTVEISGGEVKSTNSVFMIDVFSGTVTISGGKISGSGGVSRRGGTVSISGCLQLESSGRLTGTLADGTAIGILTHGLTDANLIDTCPDTAAPTTTAKLTNDSDVTDYQAGTWTKQSVNVGLTAVDSGSSGTKEIVYSATGDDPISSTTVSGGTASFTIAKEGTTTIRFHAVDNAGNVEPEKTFVVKIDRTAPSLAVPSSPVTVTATSPAGALVSFSVAALDSASGLAPNSPSATPPSGSLFGLGSTTVNATATDNAGNTAKQSFTVNVTYAWSGFQQPINTDGSSVFKAGRTIPVMFALTGPSAAITDAQATFTYRKVRTAAGAIVNEPETNATATGGTQFRYESSSGLYVYNWSTKGLEAGCVYELSVVLGDGVSRTVEIALQ